MTETKEENAIVAVQANQELAKLYQDNANLGSQNLQGTIPMLKVHTVGKSVGNELANGKEPTDGWFYLTGSQEQFENPVCHILTISRGFKSEGMADKKTGIKGEDKFNQILGGVIVEGTEYKPFIMYFTGIKLSRLWDFGKEVNKYTHAKPVGIPMFALTVKLSTERVKHDYGSSYAVNFAIQKKGDFPELVTDAGQFVFLRDNLQSVEKTIEDLISFKSTEEKKVEEYADIIVPEEDTNVPLEENSEIPF